MPACPHRSDQFRLVECPSCRGAVQVKVFQCSKHGECTQGKSVEGVHMCDGLADSPIPRPPPPKIEVPSHRPSAYESVHVGVLQSALRPDVVTALVKLDDGRDIVARNERRRQGHKAKRCVVGYRDGVWILLQ